MNGDSRRPWTDPSLVKDLVIALCITSLLVALWGATAYSYGDVQQIQGGTSAIFGGLVTLAGLLARQYLIKETLEYLRIWKRIAKLLTLLAAHSNLELGGSSRHVVAFHQLRAHADLYSKYVERELQVVPYIPVVLVGAYGTAIVSSESLALRGSMYVLMVFCVAYLARTSTTSGSLAASTPEALDLHDELLQQLKELQPDTKEAQL